MSYQVINPFIQFVDPINGKPLSGGSVYFGRQDSDPKNQPANRINVYAVQDNGTEVLLAQPITLNGAGQPQYSGSVKQIKVELYAVESAYCVQAFSKSGSQKGYSARVYSVVDIASLADSSSQVLVGGVKASALSDGATTTLRAQGWTSGDIAPYILSAATDGFKKIMLGKGTFVCSQLSLTSVFSGFTIEGVGSGLAYTPQTTIRPIGTQDSIFVSQSGVSGVDNVRFKGINFDGLATCQYGVKQLSGAGWSYEDLQGSNFVQWVLYAVQGLNYYNRIFARGYLTGGAIAAYSDFCMDNLEVTGGAVGIRVLAGGGRISNVLSNSQTECCIWLEPLDSSTNHINTALSNIYIGEVFNAAEKPIIRIKGNASRQVTDVQIVNMHTVSASADGVKHNWHIECDKAKRVVINGWSALGIGAFETANLYDAGGIKATDSSVVIASGTIHNLSRSPVVSINSSIQIGSGVKISDWGGAFATTADLKTAVLANDATSTVTIAGGAEFINERVAFTKIANGQNGDNWSIGQLSMKMAGVTPETAITFTSNQSPWSAKNFPFGASTIGQVEVFGRRVTYTGNFNSSGAGTYDLITMPSQTADQSYILTMQQADSGLNATGGFVFANGASVSAFTSGNTNSTPALQNTFTVSGSTLRATIGSGYSPTTWRWQLTRMY